MKSPSTWRTIKDDYGITGLNLHYKVHEGNNLITSSTIRIPTNTTTDQSFLFKWHFDSLLTKHQHISYYLQVSDNDQPHGYKTAKTETGVIKLPTTKTADVKIEQTQKSIGENFNKDSDNLKKIKTTISDLQNKLKSKKSLSWEDKKEIEKVLDEHKRLEKSIEDLSKNLEKLKAQHKKFDKKNEETLKKHDQLQKLMEDVLDEETKKLLKELENLLNNKKTKPETISNKLDDLEKKDINLEKELDRALDLYKKLKFEQKIEKTIDKLDQLQKDQKKDSEQEQKSSEKQDALNKKFDDIKKDLKDLQKQNEETKSDQTEKLEELNKTSEEISDQQKGGSENIKSGKSKKASENQKSAASKMKDMKNAMEDMLNKMQQEEQEEDFNNLRRILDNLVKISYDQENLINIFKKLNKVNPQFVEQSGTT